MGLFDTINEWMVAITQLMRKVMYVLSMLAALAALLTGRYQEAAIVAVTMTALFIWSRPRPYYG